MPDESAGPANGVFKTSLKRVGGYTMASETAGIGVTLDDSLVNRANFGYLPRHVPKRLDGSPAMAG